MAKSASEGKVFEGTRGHVRHRYDVRADALYYSAGENASKPLHKEVTVPWSDFSRFEVGHGDSVYLVRRNKQSFGLWVAPEEMPALLDAIVEAWGRVAPETARKAAYDYGAREPAVGWIWIVLSLAFPGMLALLLLSDGYHERTCSRLLNTSGQVTQAQVVKINKNRRGNFIWTMRFTTANGHGVTGTREAPITDPKGNPVGSKDRATIVYSQENLSCWDLSMKPGANAIDNRQRTFTIFLDLAFGWVFAVIGAVSTVFGVRRLRRRHPHRDAVRLAGERI